MTENPIRFAELLTRAINHIHADEGKRKTVIRDELGYAAGREGRTAIDYWCRDHGHVPADPVSVEGLAREIARRKGLTAAEMAAFLAAARYSDALSLYTELYPPIDAATRNEESRPPARSVSPSPAVRDGLVIEPTPASAPIGTPSPDSSQDPQRQSVERRAAQAHRRAVDARWVLLWMGVTLVAAVAAKTWARPAVTRSAFEVGQIQLVKVGEARVRVEIAGRALASGGSVPVNTPITVTFRVMNNSVGPVALWSLVIGARGPGVTCATDQAARWPALDVPFPPATDLLLQPGEEYEYQSVRAFYRPGTYFLEPAEQDATGHWDGIPAFTCFDLRVLEVRP